MGMICTALLAVLAVIGTIAVAVISRLLADDFKAWSPRLVDWIIGQAVQRLPEDQRERFDEEWRSYINDTPGDLWRPIAACGFLRAARDTSSRIAYDRRFMRILKTPPRRRQLFLQLFLTCVAYCSMATYCLYELRAHANDLHYALIGAGIGLAFCISLLMDLVFHLSSSKGRVGTLP